MKKFINLFFLFSILSFSACEKLLEPLPVNQRYIDEVMFVNPSFTEGLLMKAYQALPDDYNFDSDIACDDAVTNQIGSQLIVMATGGWRASFNPISQWNHAYEQIYYINLFLQKYESVYWASDPRLSQEDLDRKSRLHQKRLKGEAHGLRAWYQMQLLQNHAGIARNGQLLGFVILKEPIKLTDDWKLPRNTFTECVNAILTDLDTAIANLPAVYEASSDPIVNETSGVRFENRITGDAVRALKSRIAVLAASPVFATSNAMTWAQAATIAGDFLVTHGNLYNNGIIFYNEIRNKEIIWNRSQRQIRSWEEANFPPSLFGNGRTNPSQNLVDAFPMINGYPIGHPLGGYDADNPYANRDNRFGQYIITNGTTYKSQKINSYLGADLDGINTLTTSTRTGYYLRKLMRDNVSLIPGSTANSAHTYVLIRATEVLLNYAEAANEAWGPDGDPNGYGFTARSKMQQLRARAGITQPDDYLASITDQAGMRELIRNERRVELCFEGFRFWDIRRWGQTAVMNDPVMGVYITQDAVDPNSFSYTYSVVEERKYAANMIYGPIPYEETRKYNIEQNQGW